MMKSVRLMTATVTLVFLAGLFALTLASAGAPALGSATFELTVLHTNDVHARVDGQANVGGAARLATLIAGVRAERQNVVLVDAGDQFQGTLYYRLFKADVVTDTMNALGYDAMTIGNHEFDDGPAMLARLLDGAQFPVVSANIDASAEPVLAGRIAPSTIITRNGEAIGIIGLTTPETTSSSKPGPNVLFGEPADALRAEVAHLTSLGVNKIIALTHLGYQEDIALAQAVAGVDIIVGGHSHTFIYTPANAPQNGDVPAGPYPTLATAPDGKPVLVTTAFQWSRYLGRLDVTFDAAGVVVGYAGDPIFVATATPLDPTLEALVSKYRPRVQELMNTTIGVSTVDLPLTVGGQLVCRLQECLLGDLVGEVMLWKAEQVSERPYDLAIITGGTLRAPISAGSISVGQVMEVLPFGNMIATFEITGTYLLQALENGVSRWGGTSGTGRFPQVANARYAFDPGWRVGGRLRSLEIWNGGGYVPLDPQAIYRVVTIDFARQGGDGYTVLRDYAMRAYDEGPGLDEALIDYITAASVISPTLDGRIQRVRAYTMPLAQKR